MGTTCKKCGYERTPADSAPDYECPKCGAVYAKVDAYLKRKAEEEQRKKAEEEKAERDALARAKEEERKNLKQAQAQKARDRIITKTYRGSQNSATAAFQADASKMAESGYFPTSQMWAPGSYGCGAFVLALILSVVLIGIIAFIYMLIVKPDGTLSVTYELRERPEDLLTRSASDSRICPRCAETVKAAALVCRYCGHEFQ